VILGVNFADFAGGATAQDLFDGRYRVVPPKCGVYVVIRETGEVPILLPASGAGRFKNLAPSFPASEVQARWVPGACIVYIGKPVALAGSSSESAS
jgi:hypothetical protein